MTIWMIWAAMAFCSAAASRWALKLAGALGVLALGFEGGEAGLVDALGAGAAFDLLLPGLVLVGLLDLVLVDQAGFQEIVPAKRPCVHHPVR